MSQGRIALTGATGILGSWVLAEALRRGYTPVAIMRDRSISLARARLKSVLELTGLSGAERDVEILLGDSTKENFGLSAATRAGLRRSIDGLIHCAACTSFSPNQDDEVIATNVGGARNALQFAARSNAPLYHVSTAYVGGRRRGTIAERDLEHHAGFNNTYERTKNEAEQIIRAAFATGEAHGAVFRPGIIVGATGSGHICQFSNFYKLLQAVDYGAPRARRNRTTFCMFGDPTCTLNLVPVDWAANHLWDAIESEGASGQTYHLTNPTPPTLAFIIQWLNDYLGEGEVIIDLSTALDNQDALLHRATKYFEGYVLNEPVFDRTNMDRATQNGTPCPEINAEFMTAIFDYGKAQQWRSIFDARRPQADAAVTLHSQPDEAAV